MGAAASEAGIEVAVQGGEDPLCIVEGAGPSSGQCGGVLSKSSQWPFQPGGPKAALVSGVKVLVNLDTWCTAPQVFPGPVMPSLWAARGRYRPSSPAPASPWHGFGIGHLCGSHFPVPEPQPGLVEADQSIPLRRSK